MEDSKFKCMIHGISSAATFWLRLLIEGSFNKPKVWKMHSSEKNMLEFV